MKISRRDALANLAMIFGGTVLGTSKLLSAGTDSIGTSEPFLATNDIAFLNEVGETIIPTTADSAGAKTADVGRFIQENLMGFGTEVQRQDILKGIRDINAASKSGFGRGYMSLAADERHQVLLRLERRKNKGGYHSIKRMVDWGYFSSEVGCKQALVYNPLPGRFDGCIDVGPHAKGWHN